ncbi:MAG: radical SAM protein [Lentisphaerae bacterium]|nr:radical SAM protein [Lentisphaerota bacterium]
MKTDWPEALAHCELCPRRCGVNRAAGETGYCRSGPTAQIFRYGAHQGEEPPLTGARGSGAVFFSRCTLRCRYCQNYPWSQQGEGEIYSVAELAGIFRELYAAGCHNWNLVSPTPWLPMISAALAQVRAAGLDLPVVYNTSGFERLETLRALENLVDVYLTDLRYTGEDAAHRGSDAAEYVKTARAALREMWRQVGPLRVNAEGLAVRGVITRVLILPGLAAEACASLEWLAREIGPAATVSVMAQYTPAHRARDSSPWNRAITRAEYDAVARTVERLGFTEGWIQDFGAGRSSGLAGFKMAPVKKQARLQRCSTAGRPAA